MSTNEPEYIIIGEILAPWGISGKIKIAPTTDFPQRFRPSSEVYLNRRQLIIESAEWHKGNVIVKLSGLDTPEAIRKLRGQYLEIHRNQLESLEEGVYYLFQIIGLEVWTTGGSRLGSVTDVMIGASNDTYVVSDDGEDLLIPAIEDVIKSVDVESGRIVIEPMEGLLTLNSKTPKPPRQPRNSKTVRKDKENPATD